MLIHICIDGQSRSIRALRREWLNVIGFGNSENWLTCEQFTQGRTTEEVTIETKIVNDIYKVRGPHHETGIV